MMRTLRLLVVAVVLEVLLQLVVARAHVALWLFLVSVTHLDGTTAAVSVVLPDLVMQAAVGYAVARAAGVRSWIPGGAIVLALVGALSLSAGWLVDAALRPHAWQVLTTLLIHVVGTALGVQLRLTMAAPADSSTSPRSSSYGSEAPEVAYGEARGSTGTARGGAS